MKIKNERKCVQTMKFPPEMLSPNLMSKLISLLLLQSTMML
ncbi:hypothetical protein F981_04058 [Acinetobacter guillouiae CIP 63.46]|nr:hypothetical protein F981_04058 [Acinetobacter guillouiae CIP 63.46]